MLIEVAAILAMGASDPVEVRNESVVCFENTGAEEDIWISVAEKYLTGRKRWREVVLEPGKKSCIRYDGLRYSVVNPMLMSEAEHRIAEKDRIDPWRDTVCDKVSKNEAVFLKLMPDGNGSISCAVDDARSEDEIRALVREANPYSG